MRTRCNGPRMAPRRRLSAHLAGSCLLLAIAGGAVDAAPAAPATAENATVRRRGDLGTKPLQGRAYDASSTVMAPVSGARIEYSNFSLVNPGAHGELVSDASGGFAFELFVHDTDTIDIRVDAVAQGFYPARVEYGGLILWYLSDPIEVALQPGYCPGDCNQDGSVSIAELILGVGVALGERQVRTCDALDADVDGEISIAETTTAVGNALRGCVAPDPPPTATATPTPALVGAGSIRSATSAAFGSAP